MDFVPPVDFRLRRTDGGDAMHLKREDCHYVFHRSGDKWVEIPQPAILSFRGQEQKLYLGNRVYGEMERAAGQERTWYDVDTSLCFHFDPFKSHSISQVKDGTVVGYNSVLNIVYRNKAHYLGSVEHRDGWWYAMDLNRRSAVRFRDTFNKGAALYLGQVCDVEYFDDTQSRFPEKGSVYIRDGNGRIRTAKQREVTVNYCSGRVFFGIVKENGKLSRSRIACALKVFGLKYFADPKAEWEGLPRPKRILFSPKEAIDVIIDKNVYEYHKIFKIDRPHAYRLHKALFDYHEIRYLVPNDTSTGRVNLETVTGMLSRIPKGLLELGRVILFLPPGSPIIGPDAEARFLTGGLVAVRMDKYLDPRIYYHEFAHTLNIDTSESCLNRYEDGQGLARKLDGVAGYRQYAIKNWGEALAVGFEAFEKAPPVLQQIMLNIMLNPLWKPELSYQHLENFLRIEMAASV